MRAALTVAATVWLVLCSGGAWAQAAAQPEVDLKLFETVEVDRSKGCTVALWQSNRDPVKDRYAFVFIEQLTGRNHARSPARIKIGGQPVTLTRVAAGGKTSGYGLYEQQLYRMPGSDDFVILDLKLGQLEGEAVEVESGMMSVVMKGRQVFRAAVKGGAGCMTPPAPAPGPAAAASGPPPAAAATALPPLERYPVRRALIPREIVAAAQKRFDCRPDRLVANAVGYGLSEESAIWELSCDIFAYQASSVYVLVYVAAPGKEHRFLQLKAPRGKERPGDSATLISPVWDLKTRTVTSVSLGNAAGECGTLERHRVTETGDFQLIEYREKPKCDGVESKPQTWPLVFKAP